MAHRGVAPGDPRNAGPIAYFRPKPVTAERFHAQLTALRPDLSQSEIADRVARVMADLATRTVAPPPPLSQSLAEVADPWHGLGTHPDIIEIMWKLDATLPERCRWVFWGGPALVHPRSGVVFAVGMGTLGYVMRLPDAILRTATEKDASRTRSFGRPPVHDIGPAGPEWRFVGFTAPAGDWVRAAYDDAGKPA